MARDRRKHEKGAGGGSRRNNNPQAAPRTRTPDKPTAAVSSPSFPTPATTPATTPSGSPNRDTHQDPSPVNTRGSSEESVSFYQPDQFYNIPEYSNKPQDQDEEKPYLNLPALQEHMKGMALKIPQDVLKQVFCMVEPILPLIYILFISVAAFCLLLWFSLFIFNQISAQITGAICARPLLALSVSPLGICHKSGDSTKHQKIDFAKAAEAQEPLEEVLRQAGLGASLAIGMKGSEHAVRDLAMKVQSSELDCKEAMSAELGGFIRRAKPMVRKLSKFSAKVNTVVDIVIANDNYALKTLTAIQARQSPGYPMDYRLFCKLDPLGLFCSRGTPKQDEEDLKKAFIQATSSMVRDIPPLVKYAEMLLQDLEELETGLEAIADMAEEERRTGQAQDPSKTPHGALARLWDNINGEAFRQMEAFKGHSALLERVGEYQKDAMGVVVETLATLTSIQANMEEFMDLHTQNAFLSGDTPLEVHMEVIRAGVERLNRERWMLSGGSNGRNDMYISDL
ncbi:hypothetical protein AA313_de0209409 [Arthrobotrys entomopaga]|nr:hypothetical protein AA313_de0209409 [Arthrobotrys entomopaga]